MRVSPKNRVFFDSAEDAEKAGFRNANQIRNAEFGIRNYEKRNKLRILKIEASSPSAPVDLSPHLSPC